MKKKLFQFAVIHHECIQKEGSQKEETISTVVLQPDTILAGDEKVALLLIAKRIPETYAEKLHEVEILLRPF